jgi:methyl-accepting chemotaxis protein
MSLYQILDTIYFQHSIKYRLLFWFLLISLLPLGTVGYFAYSTASKTLKANLEEKMTRMVMDNLDKIDRNLLERFEAVQVWSTLEPARAAVQIGAGVGGASEFVNYLVNKYRFYTLMMILDQEGTCVTVNTVNHANEPIPTEELFLGKNFRHETWFSEAIKSDNHAAAITDWQRVNVLETFAIRTGQQPESAYSLVFSSAIRDTDGTLLGVWVTFLNWGSIQEILERIPTEIPEAPTSQMSLLLLADNQTIIAYSGIPPEQDGSLYGKSLATDLQQPQLVEMIARTEGVLTYSWGGKPKTIVVFGEKGYEDYPGKHWKYLLVSDNESVYAQVIALRSKILLIGVVSALMTIVLVYMIGNRLTAPLVLLSRAAVAIARGDLSWRIAMTAPETQSPHSRDEMGILLRSFKQMTENLQHLIRQIQSAGSRVRESSGQIAAALQQLSEVSIQQSSAILQTTATVEQFVVTSREVMKSTNAVAEFAENTGQKAKKGISAAVDTLTQIQEIKQVNDQNIEYVAFLNQCSQEINKIVDVITTIADNTELIAFNAALEAAGAGEKGKRFTVVAAEIRRLANTVATSVKSIEQQTSEIQQGIKTLVSSFEIETQKIEYGVADMQVTATSLEAILEKIEHTTAALMQISAATKQQQTANEQVVVVLQDMSQDTIQFQQIAKQTLDVTMELTQLADELLQVVNVFQIGV